jgi:predicted ArsR family transcriptional regulator
MSLRNAVVAALDRNDWKTMSDIASDAGMSKFQAKKFLTMLASEGDVERSTDSQGRVIYRPTTGRR